MKTKFKILISIFFFTFLISCDPPQHLSFINKTNSGAKIKINLYPNFESYSLKEISTADSIVFNLKKSDTANISFGIGTWSKNQIDELTNSVKSIEIETEDIKTIYKSKKAVDSLMKNNTQGFWMKSLIEINIE